MKHQTALPLRLGIVLLLVAGLLGIAPVAARYEPTSGSLMSPPINTMYLPTVFKNYAGKLDANGDATASIDIPNVPALKGVRVYTAFLTLLATAPSGVSSISNTFLFTIQ